MAKKRSKKDKIRAKAHQHLNQKTQVKVLPVVDSNVESLDVSKKIIKEKSYLEEIFAYDPRLIAKDLKKTLLVVLFVLLILLTISLLYT